MFSLDAWVLSAAGARWSTSACAGLLKAVKMLVFGVALAKTSVALSSAATPACGPARTSRPPLPRADVVGYRHSSPGHPVLKSGGPASHPVFASKNHPEAVNVISTRKGIGTG